MRNGTPHLPRPTPPSSLPRHATLGAPVALAALVALGAACGGGAAGGAVVPAPSGSEAVPVVASPRAGGDRAAEAGRRADAATDALVQGFWSPEARAFVAAPGGAPAEYWVAAQAYDAVLDGVERSGGRRFGDVAKAFVAGQQARGWERDFFDDENWMALALIRASDLTGDGEALARAEALLEDIMTNGADPAGGVWWNRQHTQKATASNAGAVITAARLYVRTGDARRLAFAERVFAYWLAEMVDPATGQVADHLEPSGEKVWWRFTYNEGAMVGAALALHRATHDPAYLAIARRTAAFMRAAETAATPAGAVLSDGPRCDGDCEEFKGIGARYLADLAEADPQGGWGDLVATSAGALWDLARDPATTTFGVDWAARSGAPTVATQSAAVMALASAITQRGAPSGARAEAPPVLALDHLVLCARTLEEGARWVRARAGVDVSPGGRHEGFGTHNALLRLGDDFYLEVLAPDPAQPDAPRGRLFGLGEAATAALLAGGPALLHWVLRSSDLAADVARLAAGAGVSPGAIGIPTAMRRGDLAWTLTVRDDRARPPAALPSVIDWGAAPHPCTRLPDAGVRLAGLAVAAPAATVAALAPLAADARLSFTVGDVPRLAADLRAG